MAGDLFYWKGQNKVKLGIYFIENVELGTLENLYHSKYWNKVMLWISSIEKTKIRYGWGFIAMKNTKIKQNLGFIPLKSLK